MSKFFISILYLFIASTSVATEVITIGNVEIKIPNECDVSRNIQNNLNCKNNPQDEEFYIALRKGDTFESHILNSTREKTIFKIENDYFARVIVDKRPFYFMYIKTAISSFMAATLALSFPWPLILNMITSHVDDAPF
ncbi:hypothetical protein [Comamonas sp.]|uniref:hypothetical protein n=1 Tax=Comamonas sp. TaxID=34028 RepID=UPI0028A04B8D|nr:hypothetical protein [Comamonas sp.]